MRVAQAGSTTKKSSRYLRYLTAAPDPVPTYDNPEAMVEAATTYLRVSRFVNSDSPERKKGRKGEPKGEGEKVEKTHCSTSNPCPISHGKTGENVVRPTSTSCKKVLYFERVVGWTEAEGREKSQ